MLELCQFVFNFVLWCGRSLPPAQDEFQKDVKSGMMDVVPHQCEGVGVNDRYLIFCFQQLVIIFLHNAEYCNQTKGTNFLRNEDYLLPSLNKGYLIFFYYLSTNCYGSQRNSSTLEEQYNKKEQECLCTPHPLICSCFTQKAALLFCFCYCTS